jgi:tetratricopeptide (TPR) repeat protein
MTRAWPLPILALLALVPLASALPARADQAVDDLNTAYAAEANGAHEQAIELYTQAIKSGRLPQVLLSVAFTNRGIAHGNAGDHGRALEDCSTAIWLGPRQANAYGCRAAALLRNGEEDKAEKDLEKALKLDPDYVWAERKLADLKKSSRPPPASARAGPRSGFDR